VFSSHFSNEDKADRTFNYTWEMRGFQTKPQP